MRNPTARFETTLGAFTVEIFLDAMPVTARNFLKLARSGFYDGLHFHRVINGFMVQFGCPHSRDPNSNLAGTGDGPDGTIRDEFTARLSNQAMTLAMANTGTPDSGSSQFFVNTVDNDALDWFTPGPSRHPVFGRVIAGAEVVRKIETVPTNSAQRPRTPVKCVRVTLDEPVAEEKPVAAKRPTAAPAKPASDARKTIPTAIDPWSILGVKRGASGDEIRAAFEAKEKELAPENVASKSRDERKAAAEEWKRVTVAFQIIGP